MHEYAPAQAYLLGFRQPAGAEGAQEDVPRLALYTLSGRAGAARVPDQALCQPQRLLP